MGRTILAVLGAVLMITILDHQRSDKTGRRAPTIVSGSKDVIKRVQHDDDAIGYVWASELQKADGVKVILRLSP